jgi:hypothetical protein
MMNDGACASWVWVELKQLPDGEVLDVSAWKRSDTDGRLFRNMLADYEGASRTVETRKS